MDAQGFAYLASISAVLCGFGFSFLGVLFVLGRPSRAIDWTTRFSVLAAATQLFCALGWTLLAAMSGDVRAEGFRSHHQVLSLSFLLGILCMCLALGASGWIRSIGMGVFTSATALATLVGIWFIVSPFVN